MQPGGVHAAGRDGDDAAGAARAEAGEQKLGQREGAEDVGGEGQLDALRVALAPLQKHSGVVDEHGELGLALGQLGGELAHRAQLCEVGDGQVQLGAAVQPLRDVVASALAAFPVAHDQVHARPGSGEPLRRRLAEPRARARDDRGAPLEAAGHGALPAQPAQAVAGRGVSGGDRDVEGGVE